MELNNVLTQEDRKKSIKRVLKDILINWFLEASPHGLKNIFKSQNHVFIKIFWTLSFLASSSYCIYALNLLFVGYYKRITYMSISRVIESPTKFPQVSFCNNKFINMTAIGTVLNDYNSSLFVSDNENLTTFMKVLKQQYKLRILFNNDTMFPLFYNNSWWLKDMLVSCYFNNKKCSINDFISFFDPYYGWCFSFNSKISEIRSIKTVSFPGVLNGLTLELFLGLYKGFRYLIIIIFLFILGNPPVDTVNEFNDGILVSIHNQTEDPFTKMDIIKVSAASETDLIINRNFIKRLLPQNGGSCILAPNDEIGSQQFYTTDYEDDYSVENETSKSRSKYNQEYCLSKCILQKIIVACGCITMLLRMPFNNTMKLCSSNQEYDCWGNYIYDLNQSVTADCYSNCPDVCNEVEYDIKSYISLYPTRYYTNVLYKWAQNRKIALNQSDVQDSFLKLNVYYHAMYYTSMVETLAKSTIDIFSDFGGTLRLCLGLSIMSFIEILELLFNLASVLVVYSKQKDIKGNVVKNVDK
jgi:hypothetical protein